MNVLWTSVFELIDVENNFALYFLMRSNSTFVISRCQCSTRATHGWYFKYEPGLISYSKWIDDVIQGLKWLVMMIKRAARKTDHLRPCMKLCQIDLTIFLLCYASVVTWSVLLWIFYINNNKWKIRFLTTIANLVEELSFILSRNYKFKYLILHRY